MSPGYRISSMLLFYAHSNTCIHTATPVCPAMSLAHTVYCCVPSYVSLYTQSIAVYPAMYPCIHSLLLCTQLYIPVYTAKCPLLTHVVSCSEHRLTPVYTHNCVYRCCSIYTEHSATPLCIQGCRASRSLLQNIVSFIGLFCTRDLLF